MSFYESILEGIKDGAYYGIAFTSFIFFSSIGFAVMSKLTISVKRSNRV